MVYSAVRRMPISIARLAIYSGNLPINANMSGP